MASYTTNVSNGYYLQLDINQISQNIANNTSYISYALYYKRGSRAGLSKTISWSFWLSGNNFSGSKAINISLASGNSSALLTTGNLTIYHDNYGNGSVAYAMSTGATSYGPTATISGSGTNYLTQIPRQARITNAPNFNDEQSPTITYNNPLGKNATLLQACISLTGEKADIVYRDIPKTETSYTFNLTDEERKLLRQNTASSNTRTVKFFIKTIIGSNTLYDAVDRTLTIINNDPVFNKDAITYKDNDPSVVSKTRNNQIIVQNISDLVVNCQKAIAKKEATIKKYDVVFNGQTKSYTDRDFGTIAINKVNLAQKSDVVITATDSRGNIAVVKKTILIYPWELPKVLIEASRVNNFENLTNIKVDTDISRVNGINAITSMICKYKKVTDTSFLNQVALEDNVIKTINLDNIYSWDLSVEVKDKFGTKTINLVIPNGKPIMFYDIEKLSVGINKLPTNNNSLDVDIINGMPALTYEIIEEI